MNAILVTLGCGPEYFKWAEECLASAKEHGWPHLTTIISSVKTGDETKWLAYANKFAEPIIMYADADIIFNCNPETLIRATPTFSQDPSRIGDKTPCAHRFVTEIMTEEEIEAHRGKRGVNAGFWCVPLAFYNEMSVGVRKLQAQSKLNSDQACLNKWLLGRDDWTTYPEETVSYGKPDENAPVWHFTGPTRKHFKWSSQS